MIEKLLTSNLIKILNTIGIKIKMSLTTMTKKMHLKTIITEFDFLTHDKKQTTYNYFLCAPLLVPRRSGCAFLFFPICFQQVKNRKACHILLVTVFAGISCKNK